jgi:hypothetical protein
LTFLSCNGFFVNDVITERSGSNTAALVVDIISKCSDARKLSGCTLILFVRLQRGGK